MPVIDEDQENKRDQDYLVCADGEVSPGESLIELESTGALQDFDLF